MSITVVPVEGMRKERRTLMVQGVYLNRQHPLLKLACGLLALCR